MLKVYFLHATYNILLKYLLNGIKMLFLCCLISFMLTLSHNPFIYSHKKNNQKNGFIRYDKMLSTHLHFSSGMIFY